jgi:hypothetical protein
MGGWLEARRRSGAARLTLAGAGGRGGAATDLRKGALGEDAEEVR